MHQQSVGFDMDILSFFYFFFFSFSFSTPVTEGHESALIKHLFDIG